MTIYVVRHGSAGRRMAGTDDSQRPLDDLGRIQADRIAKALTGANLDHVLSSPALRCRQTIEPLAASMGIHVETSADLVEGQSPRRALAIVQRLVAAGESAVLCSHGDVIPALLDLISASGAPMAGNGCAKGSIWTLAVHDGKIVEGRYRAIG